MTSSIQTHEWLAKNDLRSYPLHDDADLQAVNTGRTLPNTILVDALVAVPGDVTSVMVSAVSFTKTILSVVLADVTSGRTLGVASAILGQTSSFDMVPIQPVDPNVWGHLIFGSILDNTQHEFDVLRGTHVLGTDAFLTARAVMHYGDSPVRSMASASAGVGGIEGQVVLASNDEVTIVAQPASENGENVTYLTINLTNPEKFLPICETVTTICGCQLLPIRTINGIAPPLTLQFIGANTGIDGEGNLIRLSYVVPGTAICNPPPMPDVFGRLPPIFAKDCPPHAAYGVDPGPACS